MCLPFLFGVMLKWDAAIILLSCILFHTQMPRFNLVNRSKNVLQQINFKHKPLLVLSFVEIERL